MKVTGVKVRKLFDEGPMRTVVSITFDDVLVVHDAKVVEMPHKTIVAMPAMRMADGTYRDLVHPTAHELREEITKQVLETVEIQRTLISIKGKDK